jgi:hypothetical protein
MVALEVAQEWISAENLDDEGGKLSFPLFQLGVGLVWELRKSSASLRGR